MNTEISYKFKENEILQLLKTYIDATYGEHYAKDNKIQAFEAIVQKGYPRGLNFAIDNCLKYSWRQGDKEGQERKDIMKIIHYGMLALYCYDEIEKSKKPKVYTYEDIGTIKASPALPKFHDTTVFPRGNGQWMYADAKEFHQVQMNDGPGDPPGMMRDGMSDTPIVPKIDNGFFG